MGLFFNRDAEKRSNESFSWQNQVNYRLPPFALQDDHVGPERALTHSAVYACVDLIADIVSTFPVHRYKDVDGAKSKIEVKRKTVIEEPSELFDDVNWRRLLLVCWMLRGYAVGLVTDSKLLNRRPTANKIELIHPDRLEFYRERPDAPPTYKVDGREMKLWPRGKLWLANGKMMNPNDIVGRSILEFAASDVGLGLSARKYGKNWFQSGGHPTSMLRNEKTLDAKKLPEGQSTEDAVERVRERFMHAVSTGDPVVLMDGWDYETIQIKPEESQFLTTINANHIMVCSFFRVAPSIFGWAGESGGMVTYQNMEDKGLDLLKFTMQPWVTRMEKTLTPLLPAENEYTKLNLDALLRTDTKRRYEAYSTAVRTGFMNNNEVRDFEDWKREDGLDQFLWPPNRANMSLEEMAGDPDEGENEPITPPTITQPRPNKSIPGAEGEEEPVEEEEEDDK